MARTVVLLAGMTWLIPGIAGAQDVPITARIGPGGAAAYGGPDETHYQTSRLDPGNEVEIYRLDPGRWCAVRPPPDSFSLVRGGAFQWLDEERGLGIIVADEERCWVGTMLGEVEEPMWQLKLKRGEQVHVLGVIASAADPAQPEWYQIAPPNGEFRWVRWSDLDESSQQRVLHHFDPHTIARSNSVPAMVLTHDSAPPSKSILKDADADADAEPPEPAREIALAGFSPAPDEPRAPRAPATGGRWRTPQHRRPFNQVDYQTSSPNVAATPFVATDPWRRSDESYSSVSQPPALQSVPAHWPPQLQELDLRLSAEILKEPGQWQLDSLANDVAKAKLSGSPADAPIADHLLNKIHQFQMIQHAPTRPVTPGGSTPVQGVVAVVGPDAIPLLRVSPVDPNGSANDYSKTFDAYGWLNELVRNEGVGQSTYVLQDDNGKITHVVAATPGLNLHRYLKTKVGVVGQKGFNQQLNLDHVTAERIVSLDSLKR